MILTSIMAFKRGSIEALKIKIENGQKQYIRYNEGAELYSMGLHTFRDLAIEAGAIRKESIHVSGQEYPAELVKSKFLKLNYSHIEYVLGCMGKNTSKIYNIKSYLLTALFNAGSTMSSYYKAMVNHDMPQFAG